MLQQLELQVLEQKIVPFLCTGPLFIQPIVGYLFYSYLQYPHGFVTFQMLSFSVISRHV